MEPVSKILWSKLICLNCGNTLVYVGLDPAYGYFYCENCNNIHLNYNHIWIFLPDTHDDLSVFDDFSMRFRSLMGEGHIAALDQKRNRIKNNKKRTWEDEDTAYWNENYSQARQPDDSETTLDMRTYTRKIHLINYIKSDNLTNKLVCEIGAGQAATIRKLMSPLKYPYYYIPTDYSHEALKLLQRILGVQNNIQYIQCLGNRLPFRDNCIDYLFSLGVLHHMPQKEAHINEITPKIKPGGLFLFYEGYARDTFLSTVFFKYGKYLVEPAQSAHEERIDRANLEKILAKYRVIHYAHEYSPFLTICMVCYDKANIHNLALLKILLRIDQLVIHSIGKVFKTFSSGACFVVLEK